MSFAIYLAVSEARGFQYLFDSRNAAEAWFRNELAEISKKKVRKDFSGEIVQTYDLTTEPMSEIVLQETSSEAKAAEDKAWLADNESRLAVKLCRLCDFTAKTTAGLKSHLRAHARKHKAELQAKQSARVDADLAKLRAQDNAEGVGEDADVSPLPDASPFADAVEGPRLSKAEMLARGDDPENVEAIFGSLMASNIPPCPEPDVCLPGELTKAVQERQFALVADCPFCEEEHSLYDFVDQVTGEVHQACTACWLEVSK